MIPRPMTMQESPESVEQPPPLARHAVLHADQLCPCGYNLFGQKVDRDERLGFEVVRCPECGRFSPAGVGTPSSRPWLRRLSTLMLLAWAATLAAALGVATLVLWGLYLAGSEPYLVDRHVEAGTDRPLVEKYDRTGDATGEMHYYDARTGDEVGAYEVATVRVGPDNEIARLGSEAWDYQNDPPPWLWPMLLAIDGLIGLSAGTLVAAGVWHVGRGRWASLLMPAVPVLLAWMNFASMGTTYRLAGEWYQRRVGLSAGVTLAAMVVGLAFGRPIARWLARLLIPPGPRQALAFLWHADGKSMPAISPNAPVSDG